MLLLFGLNTIDEELDRTLAARVQVVTADDDVVPATFDFFEVLTGGHRPSSLLTDALQVLIVLTDLNIGT